MVIVACPASGCTYKTADEDAAVVVALLQIHAMEHSPAAAPPRPKLTRPQIDIGVEQEVWNTFLVRWEAFRSGSAIDSSSASTQLFHCASDGLSDIILKADPHIQSRPVEEVLSVMQSFAVIPIAKGVLRAELMQLQQSPDESFRTFAARVQGKAETCGFKTSVACQCGRTVSANYTTDTVRDVLLAGIADIDIRREALCAEDVQNKSVNDVISFVEGREMARNATPASSLSSLSTFKRSNHSVPVLPSDKEKTGSCPKCGKSYLLFKQRPDGKWNKKAHATCLDCFRTNQKRNRSTRTAEQPAEVNVIGAHNGSEPDAIVQISALETKKAIPLNERIFDKGTWRKVKSKQHPQAQFYLGLAKHPHRQSVLVNGIADTGAQSNLWGLEDFKKAGFLPDYLSPVSVSIHAANKNPINVIGAFTGKFEGTTPNGDTVSCISTVYVSDSVAGFFLSFDTMVDLLILDRNFPTIGSCPREYSDFGGTLQAQSAPRTDNTVRSDTDRTNGTNVPSSAHLALGSDISIRSLHLGCAAPHSSGTCCNCPQRTSVPERPSSLPFPPIAENNHRMKQWLLERYSSSTFNTCPHRPLPSMMGPPIEIHIDEASTPRICHTPAPVPMHWQQKVHEDLLRDEALGVIEKVPYGEPVTWCHRMVVTRKHDGSPRRTVDLSPLNKFCRRETYASDTPFHKARRVPGNTWKSVTDAWNGITVYVLVIIEF